MTYDPPNLYEAVINMLENNQLTVGYIDDPEEPIILHCNGRISCFKCPLVVDNCAKIRRHAMQYEMTFRLHPHLFI